jgi:hypothetical protein
MSVKKQLLDPLGTLCKLVGLTFCEVQTKISIQDHILTLQKPAGSQFLLRMYNSDSREDIWELYYPIVRVIKWYLVENNKLKKYSSQKSSSPRSNYINENKQIVLITETKFNDIFDNLTNNIDIDVKPLTPSSDESDGLTNSVFEINEKKDKESQNWEEISISEELRTMIKYACDALKKLQETYQHGNVVLATQFYINILEDAVNGTFDDSKLPKFILDRDREIDNLLDYEKLRNFWDHKKLKRICHLYDNCFRDLNDSEISGAQKDALLSGYLKSIKCILEITDVEFKKLIANSNKG